MLFPVGPVAANVSVQHDRRRSLPPNSSPFLDMGHSRASSAAQARYRLPCHPATLGVRCRSIRGYPMARSIVAKSILVALCHLVGGITLSVIRLRSGGIRETLGTLWFRSIARCRRGGRGSSVECASMKALPANKRIEADLRERASLACSAAHAKR